MAYPDVQQTEFNRATENLIEITWTYVNLQKEFPKLSETQARRVGMDAQDQLHCALNVSAKWEYGKL